MRTVYTIDIGKMSKKEAELYLNTLLKKKSMFYKILSFLECFDL